MTSIYFMAVVRWRADDGLGSMIMSLAIEDGESWGQDTNGPSL